MENKKLTTAQIAAAASQWGYNLATLLAVLGVEASGEGFDDATGKIIIQFEPYWYRHYTGTWVNNGVRPQAEEWAAFNQAWNLPVKAKAIIKTAKTAAMLATSWGLGQIMGFNFKRAGFRTVDAMVDAFKVSEYNQLLGMLNFIKTNKHLDRVMRKPMPTLEDFRIFAYHYNGEEYEKFDYHTRLASGFTSSLVKVRKMAAVA